MLELTIKNKILEIIGEKEPVLILSHRNPDGDAIGSSLALALFFKRLDIPVDVMLPNEVPDFLQWLPGYDLLSVYASNSEKGKELIKGARTIVMLDFNEPGRLGDMEPFITDSTAYKLLIDHHREPGSFTDAIISESWRGSVGEMIYLLIQDLSLSAYLDKDIATCIYTAIMTDTGNFRYASSYPEIFTIVGDLIKCGIEKDEIFSQVYESYSSDRMMLMGYCMSERMVVLEDYHTAYISVSKKDLERFNHKIGDTEGFVNIPFTIKGVKLTALFIEKNNHVKISLRSKGNFSVHDLAREHYRGGGHMNAAGGESDLSMYDTLKHFENILANYAEKLK